MAECAGVSCEPRKISKEDAKAWSKSLKEVLVSSEGREVFISFLEDCRFEDEVNAVNFWNECNELIKDCDKLMKKEPGAKFHNLNNSAIISKASDIIRDYCDNSSVNLDKEMIHNLNESVLSKNPNAIATSFQNAQSAAHNLLKNIHSDFADDLIIRYGLSK